MAKIIIRPCQRLKGSISLPGDKSISHRAVMIGCLACGTTRVRNFLNSEDCLRTITAFRKMGVRIRKIRNELIIQGVGLSGLSKPVGPIYLGNSGTSMRLISGIIAGQRFRSRLTGDFSLSERPMKRIVEPLRRMGADITSKSRGPGARSQEYYPPLEIRGRGVQAIRYRLPVASAQVKSAVLLAGLFADGITRVIEPVKSRDHTERMLRFFGANISVKGNIISLKGMSKLKGRVVVVPGDISSAAFFLAAAALKKGSSLTVKSVGLNPTRSAFLDVLKRMGAEMQIVNRTVKGFEARGDIKIRAGRLQGIKIGPKMIPGLIDEIPVIMVMACLAEGKTIIKGARELRVKETDRISSMVSNLKILGADIKEKEDGVVIEGRPCLSGGDVKSFKDHRTAMSMAVAGLNARGVVTIKDSACIKTSFPTFEETLKQVICFS